MLPPGHLFITTTLFAIGITLDRCAGDSPGPNPETCTGYTCTNGGTLLPNPPVITVPPTDELCCTKASGSSLR
jgi:hypothetical protein